MPSACWNASGLSSGGCRTSQSQCATRVAAAVQRIETHTRGRRRHWRPFRQRYRKRNSVNPPLIRYNGSLVVCPVLRSLGHKFACAARVRTTVPNNHRITKHINKTKQKKKKPAEKSQVAKLHITWCEGRDVCQQQGDAHATWPSV